MKQHVAKIVLCLLILFATVYASTLVGPPDDQFDLGKIKKHHPATATGLQSDTSVILTVDGSGFRQIEVEVDVLDEQGMPIPGLTESDFCVSEDGQPVGFQVTELGAQGCPTAICLVMDVSGSMYGQPLADAKQSAKNFVANMDAFDRVGVVPFGSCIEPVQSFTSDIGTLNTFIDNLQTTGATALFDGIYVGDSLTAQESGSKAVIAFTDGYENNSDICWPIPNGVYLDSDYSDDSTIICNQANGAGVTIYGISIGSAWVDPLIAFAQGTGGYHLHAPTAADMDSLYMRIKETLCSRYLVAYTSPDTEANGETHQVEICINAPACSPCGTGHYTEPAAPNVVEDPPTVALSAQCFPTGNDMEICVYVHKPGPPPLQSVTLFWRYSDPATGPYTSVVMNDQGNDKYCFTISGGLLQAGVPGIDYYFVASDGQSTITLPKDNPQQYPFTISVCPNDLPEITHQPPVGEPCSQPLSIVAEIADSMDYVAGAKLYYRFVDEVFWDSTAMSLQSGDTWSGEIPADHVLSTPCVEYLIRAWDDLGSGEELGPFTYCCDSQPLTPTEEWINVYCGVPTFDGVPLSPGDVIKAFDPDGVLCGVDVVRPDGSYGFMPIYHDDIYSEDVDEGAEPGDLLSFTINDEPVLTIPEIIWTSNGDRFELCEFLPPCVEILLEEGWNLISWNKAYEAPISEFMDLLVGCDCIDVIMSFDRGGLTYDPDLE
ncbi:MAG: VWA domain-containing protein, partial [bacterium]